MRTLAVCGWAVLVAAAWASAQDGDATASDVVTTMKAATHAANWASEAKARAEKQDHLAADASARAIRQREVAKWISGGRWEPAVHWTQRWSRSGTARVKTLLGTELAAAKKHEDLFEELEDDAEETAEHLKDAKEAAKGQSPDYLRWARLRAGWATARQQRYPAFLRLQELVRISKAMEEASEDSENADGAFEKLLKRTMWKAGQSKYSPSRSRYSSYDRSVDLEELRAEASRYAWGALHSGATAQARLSRFLGDQAAVPRWSAVAEWAQLLHSRSPKREALAEAVSEEKEAREELNEAEAELQEHQTVLDKARVELARAETRLASAQEAYDREKRERGEEAMRNSATERILEVARSARNLERRNVESASEDVTEQSEVVAKARGVHKKAATTVQRLKAESVAAEKRITLLAEKAHELWQAAAQSSQQAHVAATKKAESFRAEAIAMADAAAHLREHAKATAKALASR